MNIIDMVEVTESYIVDRDILMLSLNTVVFRLTYQNSAAHSAKARNAASTRCTRSPNTRKEKIPSMYKVNQLL